MSDTENIVQYPTARKQMEQTSSVKKKRTFSEKANPQDIAARQSESRSLSPDLPSRLDKIPSPSYGLEKKNASNTPEIRKKSERNGIHNQSPEERRSRSRSPKEKRSRSPKEKPSRSRSPKEKPNRSQSPKEKRSRSRSVEKKTRKLESSFKRKRNGQRSTSGSPRRRKKSRSRSRSRSPNPRRRRNRSKSRSKSRSPRRPSHKRKRSRSRSQDRRRRSRSRSRNRRRKSRSRSHERRGSGSKRKRSPHRRRRSRSASPPRFTSQWGVSRAVLSDKPPKPIEVTTEDVEKRLAEHMKSVQEKAAEEAKKINLPGYLNPAMVNVQQFKQVQDKRKLLWSKTKDKKEGASQWAGAFDDQNSDEKFKRLMGIHGVEVDPNDSSKVQESRKVLDDLEKEYEKSRAFQMSRGAGGITGIGLGFGSGIGPQ